MDSARSWFHKFQPRDKTAKKKEGSANGRESVRPPSGEEPPSSATKQRVAAAKQYIENHYKEQMKNLQERKERRNSLERKLADADVTEEEQSNILKHLEKKETEYMRLQRHKMGADDFKLLTMIGKGAFGEKVFGPRYAPSSVSRISVNNLTSTWLPEVSSIPQLEALLKLSLMDS